MSNVTISILIYVLNEQQNLKNCLEGIIKQTLDNIEIICIDDGSSDNSLYILKEYSLKYDFIKIFSQENQGFSIAMNRAISESSGLYIGFLNPNSNYVEDDVLEQLFDLAVKNDANIINANIKIFSKDKFINNNIRINEVFECINPEQYGMPSYFYRNIFKKSFIIDNEIYFPKLKIGYDCVFFSKALSKTDNICTTPIYLCEYQEFSDSLELQSHDMQFDYLKHFYMVFNNFDNIKFKKITDDYKKCFDNFITNQKNIFGINTIQNDLIQIFGEDNEIINNYFIGEPIKFSIVIYIHNSESYLKKCIDSCLNQSFKDIEVICVNDGSNDNSENILKDYSFDPRLKIITNSNKHGKGYSFNKGLKVANGFYINFIDSEDYLDLDFFNQVYLNETYSVNDIIIFPIMLFDNLSDNPLENGFFNLACFYGLDTNRLSSNFLIDCIFDIPRIPCNKLYNVNFLRKLDVNFLEDSYFYEDTFFFKTFLNTDSILFIDKHFYHKRIFNNIKNQIPNNIFEEVIKDTNNVIDVFKKEHYYNQCKKELLNYKIKTIRYWYSFSDEKFKKEGFYFIKEDFKSLNIQECVNYLDNHNLLFYALVLSFQDTVDNSEKNYQNVISKLIFKLQDLLNQNNDVMKINSEYKTIQVKNKLEIINLMKDNVSLERDINSLKEDNVSLERDINSLKEDNVSLERDINSLKEDNVSLENNCIALKSDYLLKISNLKNENSKLKREYYNLKRENIDLRHANKTLNKRFVDLDTKFNFILNSNSWKFTGPFRTFGKNLRKK